MEETPVHPGAGPPRVAWGVRSAGSAGSRGSCRTAARRGAAAAEQLGLVTAGAGPVDADLERVHLGRELPGELLVRHPRHRYLETVASGLGLSNPKCVSI